MASTWVTLIFGLVELPKNHHVRAGELRSCAETLDELQRELAATALSNECQLSPYIARYRAAMERCGTNPDIATLPRESDGSEPVTGRRLALVRYHVSTYSYYVGMAVAPVVVGIAIWWLRQT